jgi:transcriptional regulator with XRE-family HTH domain
MSEGISLRELARRLGRSAPSVGELAKKGVIPRHPDGTFDEDAVRAAYERNASPSQRKPLKPAGAAVADEDADEDADLDEAREAVSLIRRVLREEGRELAGPLSYDDVRTAETILKSRKHAQEIAIGEGELIRKLPVMRHIEEAFAGFRKELQAVPARYGAQIAAECGCDVAAVDLALSKVIREFLESLSAPVVKPQ